MKKNVAQEMFVRERALVAGSNGSLPTEKNNRQGNTVLSRPLGANFFDKATLKVHVSWLF